MKLNNYLVLLSFQYMIGQSLPILTRENQSLMKRGFFSFGKTSPKTIGGEGSGHLPKIDGGGSGSGSIPKAGHDDSSSNPIPKAQPNKEDGALTINSKAEGTATVANRKTATATKEATSMHTTKSEHTSTAHGTTTAKENTNTGAANGHEESSTAPKLSEEDRKKIANEPAYSDSMKARSEGSITSNSKAQVEASQPIATAAEKKKGIRYKQIAMDVAINVGVTYVMMKWMSSSSESKTSTTAESSNSTSSCVPTTEQLCPSPYNNGTYVDNAGNLYDSGGNLINAVNTGCTPTDTTLCPSSYNNGTYVDASNNLYDSSGQLIGGNNSTESSSATDSESTSNSNSTCVPSETSLCPDDVSGPTYYYDIYKNIYTTDLNPYLSSVTSLTPTNGSCTIENSGICYIGNGTYLSYEGDLYDGSMLMFTGNNATTVAKEYNLDYTPYSASSSDADTTATATGASATAASSTKASAAAAAAGSATTSLAAKSSSSCVPTTEEACPVGDGTYVDSKKNIYNESGDLISSAGSSAAATTIASSSVTTTTAASAKSSSTCVPTTEEACPVGDGTYVDSKKNIYNESGELISSAAASATTASAA